MNKHVVWCGLNVKDGGSTPPTSKVQNECHLHDGCT